VSVVVKIIHRAGEMTCIRPILMKSIRVTTQFHFIEIRAARFCFLPAGVLYNTPHLQQDEY